MAARTDHLLNLLRAALGSPRGHGHPLGARGRNVKAVVVDKRRTRSDGGEVPMPEPGPTDVVIKVAASGVNSTIDVYFAPDLGRCRRPSRLGAKRRGRSTRWALDVGPGSRATVSHYADGARLLRRVCEGAGAAQVVKIPDSVSFEQAVAVMRCRG